MPSRLKSHIILVLDRLQCVARVNCLVHVNCPKCEAGQSQHGTGWLGGITLSMHGTAQVAVHKCNICDNIMSTHC